MTEPVEVELPAALAAEIDALAEEIVAAEPVAAYLRAKDRFEHDAAARARVAKLAAVQGRIRRRQAAGQVTNEDLAELRAVRKAVEDDRVTTDYWHSRRSAVESVRGVNEALSRLLGVDFAMLAQRRGPC